VEPDSCLLGKGGGWFWSRVGLPSPRIWKEPVTSGPTKGKSISKEDIEKLLAMYYEQRGWTKNGIPTPEKLEELGLRGLVKG
jgi:aldehyde:ferredoxin oxidoreductase